MTYFLGNESKIEYVVGALKKFLKDRGCLREDGIVEEKTGTMKKFALFLVLNADFPALEEMVDKDGIDFLVWILPTIPKYLLNEMLWNFHMGKYVWEIIVLSYPHLAVEVANAVIENFKYFSANKSLAKLKVVATACYAFICRLHFFIFDDDIMSNMLNTAFINFNQCINYFISPPNAARVNNLSRNDQFKFKSRGLRMMMHLIIEVMDLFTSRQTFSMDGFDEMYLLTYKAGCYKEETLDFNMCESPNKPILECLHRCNVALLDRFQDLLKTVNIEIFCAWREFEENGKSIQEHVGELCYMLRVLLLKINAVSGHPVIEIMRAISIKPADIHDLVNTAETDTIIENINNNDTRVPWMRALINKENLLHDSNLVPHLTNNIHVLDDQESITVFNLCINHLITDREDVNVQMLAIKAFKNCSIPTKQSILEQRFKNRALFGIGPLKTPDLTNAITETFNKFVANHDVDVSEVLCLFLRSPPLVFLKIFELATENSHQTEIMFKTIILLKPFSNHYFSNETEPCVIKTAQSIIEMCKSSETKRKNVVKFICGLKDADIITSVRLLLLIIMPHMHKGLVTKDVLLINIQLKLLSAGFSIEELVPEYRAPLLALLAKVLDIVRWKINTFVPLSPSTLQLALELQNALFQTFPAHIPGKY